MFLTVPSESSRNENTLHPVYLPMVFNLSIFADPTSERNRNENTLHPVYLPMVFNLSIFADPTLSVK